MRKVINCFKEDNPVINKKLRKVSGGGDSIADSFDVCNWRPDSETVASRAFAHASIEKFESWGVIILSY